MWNPMETMGMGHRADSLIAHITPKEAMILRAIGGKGSVNPHTGFLQFFDGGDGGGGMGDDDNGDSGGMGDGGGYGDSGGFGDSGGLGNADQSDADAGAGMSGFGGYDGDYGGDYEGGGPGEGEAEAAAAAAAAAESSAIGGELGGGIGLGGMDVGDRADQDINPQNITGFENIDARNMGMMESFGARARASLNSFMDNPLAAMMPSMTSLATILGALSPMPGGMMMGYGVGRMADKYGYGGEPTEIAESPGAPGGEPPSGPMTETMAAPMAETPAGLSPSPAAAAFAPSYSSKNYMNQWRNLANRGTGGGGLSRLLRG